MVDKFTPELNKVYLIDSYTLLHFLEGRGSIEVDFQTHHDWQDKLIFLDKGQYIKFHSENFVVRRIQFSNEVIFRNKDIRVLFKHLVGLGYINFNECEACQSYLSNTVFSSSMGDIVDVSSKQWFWENPFDASKEEYHVIFDIKDIIDTKYKNHLSNESLSSLIGARGYESQALFKNKIGFSVKSLLSHKRFLESKKEIVFTDKSVKEIAYQFGFKDPAYFNRVFRKMAGESPNKFRDRFDFEERDTFLPELYHLLDAHHKEHRNLDFYAVKMNISVKTLSKKVKDKLNTTIGQLIRFELINTAKFLLQTEAGIKEIAYELGFEETNHFSSFFKHYTSSTPMEYRQSSDK